MPLERERFTARTLIVTQTAEILLLSVKLPWMKGNTWTLPGGGIEDNETAAECARREVFEEVGYAHSGSLTPCWHTTIEFEYKDLIHRTHEQYFVARIDEKFEPTMANMMDYELDFSLELRWWTLNECEGGQSHFSPKQLPQMLAKAIAGQLPHASQALHNPMPSNYFRNPV